MRHGAVAARRMQEFMTETFRLVKANGKACPGEFKGRKGEHNKIITFESGVAIEPNDHLLRVLSNGLVEDYIVDDPGFHEPVMSFPAHYQATVRRSDQPAAQPQTIINNISGANARINLNSTDNSNNTAVLGDYSVFTQMRDAAEKQLSDASELERVLDRIEKLEGAAKSGNFVEEYKAFTQQLSAHMTIFSPFISALSVFF